MAGFAWFDSLVVLVLILGMMMMLMLLTHARTHARRGDLINLFC